MTTQKITIVRYTRKDHCSEWSTNYHIIPFRTIPYRDERGDLDIHYWLYQFPEVSKPNKEPDDYESRGDAYTEHIIEYFYF